MATETSTKTIDRRKMMIGAGILIAGNVPAAASTTDANRELIEIAARLPALIEAQKEAEAAHAELWQQYEAREPAKPDALRWRLTDPCGHVVEYLDNGKGRVWCLDSDIEKLRTTPRTRLKFIGTDEE
jgi:hypothetical protein